MRIRKQRRGFALATCIAVLSVLFLLAFAYGSRTSAQLAQTTRTVAATQAEYLAEAGALLAFKRMTVVALPYQETVNFSTGTVTLSIAEVGTNRVLYSTARTGRVTRTLRVTVDEGKKVQEWVEDVL